MPKRSATERIEKYNAKIRKLQYKAEKNRRRRIVYSSSSSDSEENLENGTRCVNQATRATNATIASYDDEPQYLRAEPSSAETPPRPTTPGGAVYGADVSSAPATPPSPHHTLPGPADPPIPTPLDHATENVAPPTRESSCELDPELLEALGEATEDVAAYGPNIHNKLAQRWLPILKKGLQTEVKEKLLKEYIVPENCKLLKAPTLNPEIAAALHEFSKGRDKKIQTKQDQLGLGITAVNKAMTLLLTGEDKCQVLKTLSDGCRILTDLHFTETQSRIKLITPGLEKSFLSNIQQQERDETLFGASLSEKIKASKALERQGQQIKKSGPPKTTSSSTPATPLVQPRGNWTGPPRYQYQSGRGGRNAPPRNQYRRGPTPVQATAPAAPRQYRHSTSTAAANKRAPTL